MANLQAGFESNCYCQQVSALNSNRGDPGQPCESRRKASAVWPVRLAKATANQMPPRNITQQSSTMHEASCLMPDELLDVRRRAQVSKQSSSALLYLVLLLLGLPGICCGAARPWAPGPQLP